MSEDTQNDKLMGVLAYLGILVLIPIFAAKDSKFARFHANQGLILCIIAVAWGILISIISGILIFSLAFGIVAILNILSGLVWIGVLVLIILGIVNVCNGQEKELPIIGKYKILK